MTSPLTSLVKEHTEAGYPAARKNNWLRNLGQVRGAVFAPTRLGFCGGPTMYRRSRQSQPPTTPLNFRSTALREPISTRLRVTCTADVSRRLPQTLTWHRREGTARPLPEGFSRKRLTQGRPIACLSRICRTSCWKSSATCITRRINS
jgi:hypothetical protein